MRRLQPLCHGITLAFTAAALLCAMPTAQASCVVPPAEHTIDPPGFYDDPAGYQQAVKPMRAYIDRLNKAAEAGDWACTIDLLAGWAQGDALMGPITGYQRYYERSWAGTDFALVLMRAQKLGRLDAPRAAIIDNWLTRIAIATRDAQEINSLHNNLTYWAGLNLVAIGTVARRGDLVDDGVARVREGIRDIGPHGELQRELKRGDRALHYHTFALLPLVFTAELVRPRNIDLYAENQRAIGRLADLVTRAVQDPNSFRAVSPIKQELFPWTFQDELSWMEPYYASQHDTRLPALIAARRAFHEWRLGGNVTQAWGVTLP
ncbi:alginate lyase family protein [Ralstonia pickettii]|jgi:poly(beta-D-mannuronate) lyase|uniref:alginate lyase family protein n=1 Tax=Ralstonia insidiosa TaxID=190721 RepID=UPI000664BA0B|nr:alginate lyase family protein [Ralstonia insidiosa]KMW47145.1 poly(beta-D-mannuronate) lyase [Ralstonia sp. MD27]MBX3775652.1 alginate lyase family protein [Ralstonia pickettii]NOZ15701.1 poly(beta-D-mannuronate) lyase [Betaproteobacteria bacterium]MBA9873557.1 poly(beta-D-mannuronate) lyase [Ralstonia insidiosa]MBA9916277.1 poly(beta-D-mannuronate) lyase [Ralstonia insidiosa]